MSRGFNVGDLVIIEDVTGSDSKWSFYLDGSTGTVRKADGFNYRLEFENIVDAHPDIRAKHNYQLNFLVENANISGNCLKPFECENADNGFDSVFD